MNMTTIGMPGDKDQLIEQIKAEMKCTVLYCEGRPCLEYKTQDELDIVTNFVQNKYNKDILDVFYIAIPALEDDE